MKTFSEKVEEYRKTLLPVQEVMNSDCIEEMYGIAEETLSYNSSFRVYEDFGCNITSCVFQKIQDLQVVRFYSIDTSMSADGMRRFCEDIQADKDDDYMDEQDYNEELEIGPIIEYKQMWLDRKGRIQIVELAPLEYNRYFSFVYLQSVQEWITNFKVSANILANVEECDFCHTCADSKLSTLNKMFEDGLMKYNHDLAVEILNHGFLDEAKRYYRTLAIATKHGYQIPTGYEGMRMYFRYLSLLQEEGICLTEPFYVCPQDLRKEYNKFALDKAQREAQKEFDRLMERAQNYAPVFNKEHSYLFGIEFDSEHFHFTSLDSTEAYVWEGYYMAHCIGRGSFYQNHDVLSLHIDDHEGNRVATCSINVKEQTIVQLQTIGNEDSWRMGNDYKDIERTLMARMHTFPRKQEHKSNKSIKIAV